MVPQRQTERKKERKKKRKRKEKNRREERRGNPSDLPLIYYQKGQIFPGGSAPLTPR